MMNIQGRMQTLELGKEIFRFRVCVISEPTISCVERIFFRNKTIVL